VCEPATTLVEEPVDGEGILVYIEGQSIPESALVWEGRTADIEPHSTTREPMEP
jgi:hypothetical protein